MRHFIYFTICILLFFTFCASATAQTLGGRRSIVAEREVFFTENVNQNATVVAFSSVFLNYFRRYQPVTEINAGEVIGSAKYGRYPVEFKLETIGRNHYKIIGQTTLNKPAYLEKWMANIEKNFISAAR